MQIWNQFLDKVNTQRDQIIPKNFFLKAETNGFLPYNTATIGIKAFKDKKLTQEVHNFSVRWYKEIENRKYKIECEDKTYFCSYEDIGSIIIAVAQNEENSTEIEAQ